MSDDPSEMVSTFQEIFEHLLNFHAPLKKRKVKYEYAPLITSDINRSMEERNKMKKLALKDPNLWPRYKILRNKVSNNLRLSFTKYCQGLVSTKKMFVRGSWPEIFKASFSRTNQMANKRRRQKCVKSFLKFYLPS